MFGYSRICVSTESASTLSSPKMQLIDTGVRHLLIRVDAGKLKASKRLKPCPALDSTFAARLMPWMSN